MLLLSLTRSSTSISINMKRIRLLFLQSATTSILLPSTTFPSTAEQTFLPSFITSTTQKTSASLLSSNHSNIASITKNNNNSMESTTTINPNNNNNSRTHYVFGSLTRISDLFTEPFDVKPLSKNLWGTGDYVVGKYVNINNHSAEISGKGENKWVEESGTGRRRPLYEDDLVVGAFGIRKATLEAVCDWHYLNEEKNEIRMQDICGSGMFGKQTSQSTREPMSPSYIYQGHVMRHNQKITMNDFVSREIPESVLQEPIQLNCPVILVFGSSMSCGKTIAAGTIIPLLKHDFGYKNIVGAKLTGAGFYHDIQSMMDAGAHDAYDFVDVGLPSTVMDNSEEYRHYLRKLLYLIQQQQPDCIVAEVGGSLCEPYNGWVVLDGEVNPDVLVLCASDPYAVLGLQVALQNQRGIKIQPDVVTGMTASTSAGVDMVHQLTGHNALNLSSSEGKLALKELLQQKLFFNKNDKTPPDIIGMNQQDVKYENGFNGGNHCSSTVKLIGSNINGVNKSTCQNVQGTPSTSTSIHTSTSGGLKFAIQHS